MTPCGSLDRIWWRRGYYLAHQNTLRSLKDLKNAPRKALLARFFQKFGRKGFCKLLHNVTARPRGLFLSECLDPHYIATNKYGNGYSVFGEDFDCLERILIVR